MQNELKFYKFKLRWLNSWVTVKRVLSLFQAPFQTFLQLQHVAFLTCCLNIYALSIIKLFAAVFVD